MIKLICGTKGPIELDHHLPEVKFVDFELCIRTTTAVTDEIICRVLCRDAAILQQAE